MLGTTTSKKMTDRGDKPDLVAVGELPDAETAMAFALVMSKAGNVPTETLRAFSFEEVEAILKKVP